jgi:hypothetical protein
MTGDETLEICLRLRSRLSVATTVNAKELKSLICRYPEVL